MNMLLIFLDWLGFWTNACALIFIKQIKSILKKTESYNFYLLFIDIYLQYVIKKHNKHISILLLFSDVEMETTGNSLLYFSWYWFCKMLIYSHWYLLNRFDPSHLWDKNSNHSSDLYAHSTPQVLRILFYHPYC